MPAFVLLQICWHLCQILLVCPRLPALPLGRDTVSNMAAHVLDSRTASFFPYSCCCQMTKIRLLHGHNFDQFKLRKLEEGKKTVLSIIVIIISRIISLLIIKAQQ